MVTQIKLRRDTEANWTLNGSVVLAAGEPGFETDTGRLKIGNGNDDWSTLSYISSSGSGDRLVNGLNSVVLEDNGSITAPYGVLGVTTQEEFGISADADTAAVILSNNGAHKWVFGVDGKLTLPGAIEYPNVALQRDAAEVNCQGNTTTVAYTVSGQYQHTIKLLIQVEGNEIPNSVLDTQACEMIIAKSHRANDIASTVYGVVHTSVAPLATFTAQWNATSSRVEVLCTTPSVNNVIVRIFATEIQTAD